MTGSNFVPHPCLQNKQELNITPKPTKNKNKEALKATQAKENKEEKEAKKPKNSDVIIPGLF